MRGGSCLSGERQGLAARRKDKAPSPNQRSFHTSITPTNRGRKRRSSGSIPPRTVWKPQPGVRGHGKDVELRLLLLAAVTMAARARSPQTNRQTWIDIEKRHEAKVRAALSLRRVTIPSSIVCVQPINSLKFCVGCRV